jgi:hypothetical protein
VPLIGPLADKVSPAGRDPEATDHEYPPAPPVAASVWLYAAPNAPFGSDAVVIAKGGSGATVRVRAMSAVFCELSLTWTVKSAGAAAVGVPLIVPPAAKLSPAGRNPKVTDHE